MSFWKHKVVVVTGASSGIGEALVQQLLAGGARVAACGRNLARLTAALGKGNENLMLLAVDVSKEMDCRQFIADVESQWDGVDILINNAGISMRALFAEVEIPVLRELMEVNFWGAVYCTQAALSTLVPRKGVVVGISSIAGYRGLPARTGYSASKAALQAFLEALRTELLHTGATAIWVSPGFTASNIRNVARSANGNAQGETPLAEDKLMSAAECARQILIAVEKRQRNKILTLQGKLTVFLNRLFPRLADRLVYRHFAQEADSPLKK